MQLRPLGRTGLEIAPLMLGGNVFGWTVDLKGSCAILDAFVDAGFNAVDTADTYSRWAPGHEGGESEIVIGKWLKQSGKRDKVVIVTKTGEDMGEGRSLRKEYILRACEASLRRLQTDHIDLYLSHFDDEVTPVEETMEAYAQLIKTGKVRAVGASNVSPARLEASLAASRTLGIPRYEVLQPLYSLIERQRFEQNYADICRREKLGVVTYYALAAGFLTGKYRTAADAAGNAARGGKVKNYLNDRGLAILKALDEVASRNNATPAQVSLAWLIAQPLITAPIVSATTPEQLQDILKAPALALTPEDLAALDKASA
jgi:aryl-alcohol dehydrogenase-like predicted oxidoreductase